LWIDSLGGLAVGVVVAVFADVLADWYHVPRQVLMSTASANLAYGAASFALALTPRWRTPWRLRALALANLAWGVVCAWLLSEYGPQANLLGAGQFALEGLYVASLGLVEWWMVSDVAATATAEGPRWRLLECRVPPPVVALLAAGGMRVLAREWPSARFTPLPTAGLAVAVAGVALAVWAMRSFRRAATTIHPLEPHKATQLVVAGPNRWTRNPMYVGLLVVLVGWGLWLGSAPALMFVPLAWGWLTRFQVGPEERALDARFGEAYRSYRASVRRWL
jgi:protein-S-isoprenylcysteine O-methyltransferase Ste14